MKDLKGKKIALQDVTSTAGYTFPLAMLKNEAGINATKDMKIVNVKGHDQTSYLIIKWRCRCCGCI